MTAKKKLQKKSKPKKVFSLVQPQGMGGIIGGKGYRFQDGYTIYNIAKWIADKSFIKFMPEGTGDVDVVFQIDGNQVYDHYQVKNHTITNSEFKEVIKTFIDISVGTGNVYRKFYLVAPSFSNDIKSLIAALTRYRDAQELYDEKNERALNSTRKDVLAKLEKLSLSKEIDFILQKLSFETSQVDFSDINLCRSLFISALAEQDSYRKKVHDVLRPAFGAMLETIQNSVAKTLDQKKIIDIIDSALAKSKNTDKATVLHVHNWTNEKFDNKATITLDWSNEFDRVKRQVPDSIVWNSKFLPELVSARTKISSKTSNRHVIFRGKCTLSTGIALGITFPEIGNWTFELIQPPQGIWYSASNKIPNFQLNYKSLDASHLGWKPNLDEIAFVFNITGSAKDAVLNFLREKNLFVKTVVLIEPGDNPSNTSIKSDSEAISIAYATKDILKSTLSEFNATKTHLFFYGPLGLSIFLGQKLSSVGEIQLYEFQDPGYKPTFLLRT